jgi:hypothetical protein
MLEAQLYRLHGLVRLLPLCRGLDLPPQLGGELLGRVRR